MKELFLDVGELGWSFYLSAHMRWLRKTGGHVPAVMVLPGRECLYEGIADEILRVPSEFLVDFDSSQQNRFVLYNADGAKLKIYLNPRLPMGYFISESQPFDCHLYNQVYVGKMLFEPYSVKVKMSCPGDIFVFPRCREHENFRFRNLLKWFYIELIDRLCDEFKDYIVRTVGTKDGAYNITEVKKDNYINFVGATPGIQYLIDMCQLAVGAVGSQSAPLKLTLLQGVPSFMVGHEPERHMVEENWRRTKVGFYEIPKESYHDFDFATCVDEVVTFMRSCL